jgi:hypothetical protein
MVFIPGPFIIYEGSATANNCTVIEPVEASLTSPELMR